MWKSKLLSWVQSSKILKNIDSFILFNDTIIRFEKEILQ